MQRRSLTGAMQQGRYDNEYRQLWCAVMVRALDDFATLVRVYKSIQHPAVTSSEPYQWLLVSDKLTPGSFHWICGHLGFDVEITRQLIRHKWRELMKKIKTTIPQMERANDSRE